MKRPKYEKTFEVGKDEAGRRVFVTVELGHRTPEYTTTGELIVHETVAHEKVTEWLELSITGVVQGSGGGQIRDVLSHLSSSVISTEQVRQIAEVWERWHLNGMKAGCVHQSKEWTCPRCKAVNGWHLKPIYSKRGDECTDCGLNRWDAEPCPNGYHYGRKWLVDPLPAEIVEQVKVWGAGQGERDAYAEQARDFLRRFGLEVKAAFKGDRCPPWEKPCNHSHGDRYRVTVKRTVPKEYDSQSVSFDFWNSQADMQKGKRPSAYDILSCMAADAFAPTDPDEVVEEFGGMKPSQAAAVAKFAVKLRGFFTASELEALREVE